MNNGRFHAFRNESIEFNALSLFLPLLICIRSLNGIKFLRYFLPTSIALDECHQVVANSYVSGNRLTISVLSFPQFPTQRPINTSNRRLEMWQMHFGFQCRCRLREINKKHEEKSIFYYFESIANLFDGINEFDQLIWRIRYESACMGQFTIEN